MNLNEIGVKHGTDKSSLFHHYLPLYELLFRHLKLMPAKILEVGIHRGNSVRTWTEYFEKASIWAIDLMSQNMRAESQQVLLYGNAYSKDMLTRLGGNQFDVIIDDGSHNAADQAWFVTNYPALLKPNGILIVEDVLTNKTIPTLVNALPNDFNYTAVDMSEGHSNYENDRLFIAWRP